jgi:hypothetical protein
MSGCLVVTSNGSARCRRGDAGFCSFLPVQHALVRAASRLSCAQPSAARTHLGPPLLNAVTLSERQGRDSGGVDRASQPAHSKTAAQEGIHGHRALIPSSADDAVMLGPVAAPQMENGSFTGWDRQTFRPPQFIWWWSALAAAPEKGRHRSCRAEPASSRSPSSFRLEPWSSWPRRRSSHRCQGRIL